jgi:hypothetical protein
MIYILVNIFYFFLNVNDLKQENFKLENFFTAFWDMGLLFHGLSVFWKYIFWKSWEDKKIKELMKKKVKMG